MSEPTEKVAYVAQAPEHSPKPKTFRDLIESLDDVDALIDADLNPEEIVAELRTKVDGLDRVINFFKFAAEVKEREADRLSRQAATARAKVKSLNAYVLTVMQANNWEKVPGELVTVSRQKTGVQAVEVSRPASAIDVMERPEFVRVVPQSYEWDKKVISAALKSGTALDFATLRPQTETLKWANRIPEKKS